MAGRKSKAEELKIIERYAELTEPFFKVLKEALEGKNKRDKHWAIEQLSKGFVKMIPQKLAGDKENPVELLVKFIDGKEDNRNPNRVQEAV